MGENRALALLLSLTVLAACGGTAAEPSCEDVTCGANASCELDAADEPVCVCDDGFDGDGQACEDVDECAAGTDDCDDAATCSNTPGGFTCACPAGYDGDGTTCTDIDECTLGTDDCGDGSTCTNTDGGFACSCPAGTSGDGDTCVTITLTPPAGKVGDTVTITALGFGASPGTVTFDGVAATVSTWSDSQIEAVVPDVLPGVVPVAITPAATPTVTATFEVVLPDKIFAHSGASVLGGNAALIVMDFNPVTGAITESASSPVELGSADASWGSICAEQMTFHRDTRRLFVTSGTALDVFDVDPITGDLTAVPGSPLTVVGDAYGVSVTDAGDRALVTSYSTSNVTIVDVMPDGTLVASSGSPTATLSGSTHTLPSPDGAFAFANSSTNLGAYSIGADGALTALAPLAGRGGSGWVIHHRPGSPQIYVPDDASFEVVSYDPVTGALAAVAGSPFPSPGGNVGGMAFSADGSRLFTRAWGGTTFGVYDLDAAGVPTPVAGSPYTLAGSGDMCMRVSQDGAYLVTGNEGAGTVEVYTLDGNGAPTAVGSPFAFTVGGTSASSIEVTF